MGRSPFHDPISHLRTTLLAGLLILAPISLTAYILYKLFQLFDGLLRETIIRFVADHILHTPLNIYFPGIGILALLALLLLTGSIAKNFVGRRIITLGDWFMRRIPLANRLYTAIREIAEAVFSEKREIFKNAVLFEYPRPGLWSIGFFTQDTQGPIQEALEDDVVSVFLPTTPNPTSGFLLYVPKSSIRDLDISVEDAMKVIISAGALHIKGDGNRAGEAIH